MAITFPMIETIVDKLLIKDIFKFHLKDDYYFRTDKIKRNDDYILISITCLTDMLKIGYYTVDNRISKSTKIYKIDLNNPKVKLLYGKYFI